MSADLRAIWSLLNDEYFGGRLNRLAAIGYEVTSGPDGIAAHGVYFDKSRSVVIDQKFQFDRSKAAAGDQVEQAKADVVHCLVLHEMIHQALHERGVPGFGKHGPAFIEEATRIAPLLSEAAPTTADEAKGWPDIKVGYAFLIAQGAVTP